MVHCADAAGPYIRTIVKTIVLDSPHPDAVASRLMWKFDRRCFRNMFLYNTYV